MSKESDVLALSAYIEAERRPGETDDDVIARIGLDDIAHDTGMTVDEVRACRSAINCARCADGDSTRICTASALVIHDCPDGQWVCDARREGSK